MRHRYRVDLYDDVPIEAQIADLVESMPRARRQEFLRTMIKVGFLNTYGANSFIDPHVPSLPKEIPRQANATEKKRVNANQESTSKGTNGKPKNKPNEEARGNSSPPSTDSNFKEPLVKEVEDTSKENDFNIPSIKSSEDIIVESNDLDAESNNSDDDIVDGLDEFNGLFNGLNES